MERLAERVWRRFRRFIPRYPLIFDHQRSSLPLGLIHRVQEASFRFKFAGRACTKNPFDLALYAMLLSELRPSILIEIGSQEGGSAKFFATLLRGLGLETAVWSFDVKPVQDSDEQGLSFRYADIHDLAQSALPAILSAERKGPILVVEDGPHTYEGCLAALGFFGAYLSSGDYIVVEDGILKDLRYRGLKNGPNRAVDEFLRNNSEWIVDREYCDFYGRNATWNTNGYLRKS